ncbi:MAG: hypothetical protein GWN55_04375 [Phycisphaerae bacterium]|nr:hypothetical protein [Phycisphaerae bacterium]NIR63632.1 hypothetical protein [candidate division Zixibacteria bacterium]NIP56404.1 hypothetical protein [Phycisphaerae bacterium]NIS54856.1 hypothetical protein [Phycisphaerae bacterium]NIU13720.1 hypothetical protein [candidate division Zixibacteria bacterium]
MEKLRNTILIASLVLVGLTIPVRAEMVTMDEALTAARNWITLIIQKKGNWGGSETAEVEGIQEFKRGRRVIGYFCRVKPKGHIIISLRKELAPIKTYSSTSDLAPECEEGIADLVKGKMERILDEIERQVGPITSARTEEVSRILEIDYRPVWAELSGNIKSFKEGLESETIETDYQEGQVLLSSPWHQGPPYNNDCPNEGCSWPDFGFYNQNAVVGCGATASSQIMHYWCWPPYGVESPYNDTYDWLNMPNRLTTSSPMAQVNAVAELCHEVGVAQDMHYDCDGSSTQWYEVDDAFEDHFRYSTNCDWKDRDNYDAGDWFNRMKAQLNANRPVQYRVEGHSIVGDGWQEIGSPVVRQYHMNYGWGRICGDPNGCNTWYTLDALHLGDYLKEKMLESIFPAQALGTSLSGTYSRQSFPYRYFDRYATGSSATFEAGQYLQFLPLITAKCTSTTGDYIRFVGSSSLNTRLFSIRGTSGTATVGGIRIYNGGIRLYQNGCFKFHE